MSVAPAIFPDGRSRLPLRIETPEDITGEFQPGAATSSVARFINPQDTDHWTIFQAGLTQDQRNYSAWLDYLGHYRWLMGRNASSCFILYGQEDAPVDEDVNDPSGYFGHVLFAETTTSAQGATRLNSRGRNGRVLINTDPFAGGMGEGGLEVWSGGPLVTQGRRQACAKIWSVLETSGGETTLTAGRGAAAGQALYEGVEQRISGTNPCYRIVSRAAGVWGYRIAFDAGAGPLDKAVFDANGATGEVRLGAIGSGGYFPVFYSDGVSALGISTSGKLALKSPDGHWWGFSVDDSGVLSAGTDLGTVLS